MEQVDYCNFYQWINVSGSTDTIKEKITKECIARIIHEENLKGFKQCVRRLSDNNYTKLIKAGKLDYIPELLDIRELAMRPVDRFMFITVNAEFKDLNWNDVTYLLIKQVEKWVSRKKLIRNAAWCYEQKGTTMEEGDDQHNIGYHPHAHILCELEGKIPSKSKFKDRIKNTFKDVCCSRDSILNYKVIIPGHVNRKISYMYKLGREQNDDIIVNNKWRKKMGMREIVSFSPNWSQKKSQISDLPLCESSDEEEEEDVKETL